MRILLPVSFAAILVCGNVSQSFWPAMAETAGPKDRPETTTREHAGRVGTLSPDEHRRAIRARKRAEASGKTSRTPPASKAKDEAAERQLSSKSKASRADPAPRREAGGRRIERHVKDDPHLSKAPRDRLDRDAALRSGGSHGGRFRVRRAGPDAPEWIWRGGQVRPRGVPVVVLPGDDDFGPLNHRGAVIVSRPPPGFPPYPGSRFYDEDE